MVWGKRLFTEVLCNLKKKTESHKPWTVIDKKINIYVVFSGCAATTCNLSFYQ